jgi:pheromone shutdown protein TraB
LNRNLLFSLFEILERTVGKELGVSPGTEMLEASRAAEEVGARLELIDFPISETASCMDNLPFMEKTRLFIDGLTSILLLMLPWRKTSTVLTSLDEALKEFSEVMERDVTTICDIEANIEDLLDAISIITKIKTADISQARLSVDVYLRYWEIQWYLMMDII